MSGGALGPLNTMGRKYNRYINGWGGAYNMLAHEDGKVYRGVRQFIEPVIEHVDRQNELVNSSSGGWRYAGSVPMVMIVEWLRNNGYTMEDFGKDENVKKKFLAYWQGNEFNKFHAKDYVRNRYSL